MMANKNNPNGTQRIGANCLNVDAGLKFTPTEQKDRTINITVIVSYLLTFFMNGAIYSTQPNASHNRPKKAERSVAF